MASDSPIETILTILFWGIVFVVGGILNARKKKQQEQEALETQAQLQRVDEAVRASRQRRGRGPEGPARPDAAPVAYAVEASPAPGAGIPPGPVFQHGREQEPAYAVASMAGSAEAATPFAPPTAAEIRQALAWREILGPCAALRTRPW